MSSRLNGTLVSDEDYIGDFKSSNHIFVFDDEELEQN